MILQGDGVWAGGVRGWRFARERGENIRLSNPHALEGTHGHENQGDRLRAATADAARQLGSNCSTQKRELARGVPEFRMRTAERHEYSIVKDPPATSVAQAATPGMRNAAAKDRTQGRPLRD